MKANELLEELGKRDLEPQHALLYRAAKRTLSQVGWLSKELISLLRSMLENTCEKAE